MANRYGVLLGIVLGLGIGFGLWAVEGKQAFKNGSLVRSHAEFEQQCSRCHEPWQGVSNDKCIACHKLRFESDPDHGASEPRCAVCHYDHRGRGHDLREAGRRRMRVTGVTEP